MSSLLNHIDNNRSEDDEDDHINRLFPKCKPRASSLSMSPSLQHMSHDSTNSSTSASDICLTTSDLLSVPIEGQTHNSNFCCNNKNNSRNQCNTRRHSSNSPGNHYSNDLVGLQQDCWNQSGRFEEIIPRHGHIYDNNNAEYISGDCLNTSVGTTTSTAATNITAQRNRTSVGKYTTESTHKPISSSNKYKKCDNHNFQQRNVARNPKSDRKQIQIQSNGVPVSQPHNPLHHPPGSNPTLHFTSVSATTEASFDRGGQQDSSNRVSAHQNFSSVISGQGATKISSTGLCEKREDKVRSSNKDSVTKALSSLSSANSSSLIAMECNAMEDNFDNGIGSGCSRSSGESNHSNTSDFMENLVSPVAGIRGPAVSSNSSSGGNGFPSSTVLTPTMGALRDSRIEIAGGREVFSQNRIRASRRHRSSSYATSSNEVMADPSTSANISSSKMRKKSLHSHTASAYQHHHCCHTSNPCCGSTANCPEVALPPGSLVWEPNHSCRRPATEASTSRQQYLSHSHSLGGPSQCVKCTPQTPHGCGCCGGHHGFGYSKTFAPEFETVGNGIGRNLSQLHGTAPTSPMTIRETVFSSEVRSIENSAPGGGQVIEKGNQLPREIRSPCQTEPVIYETVVGDGKVVFDDIGEWRERHADTDNPVELGYDGGDEHDLSESQAIKKRQLLQSSPSSSKDTGESSVNSGDLPKSKSTSFVANNAVDLLEGSPCTSNRDGNTTPSGYESDECSASASATNNSIIATTVPNMKTSPNIGNKRIIGSIPIAEYEGSPKRYGLKQPTHPVSTHFDLVDVDIGLDINTETENNLIGHETRAQSLIDQTAAAATSSSSSSLDNTNTNVSSNSSSRTNNRISPRALSPSQPISSGFTRFPGFPQRVNASCSSTKNEPQIQTVLSQTSPDYDNSASSSSRTVANRKELNKSPVNDDLIESENHPTNKQYDPLAMLANVSCLTSEAINGQLSMKGGNTDFSPDDSIASQHGSVNTTLSTNSDQEAHCSRKVHPMVVGDEGNLVDTDGAHLSSASSRSQDLLYEFSETRKVLEEFFNASGNPSLEYCSRADKASFDELDYTLKRQAGNSYVGQRLAGDVPGNFVAEDSPKKPPRRGVLLLGSSDGDGSDEKGSPKLISFQEISLPQMHSLSPSSTQHQQQHRLSHMQSHSLSASNRSPRSLKSHSRSQSQSPPPHDPTRDINDNDIDVETASTNTETDLGETEVGMQVGHSRNFTLSPETTDCDSNELESELSLDYEASLHSSSRVGVTMPVVEDGLSSGNDSENEIIEVVDDGFRDEHCYLTGTEIKTGCSPSIHRKSGAEPGSGTKIAIYQNNKDTAGGFFSLDGIQGELLDWSVPNNTNFNIGDDKKPISGNNPNDPNPTLMLMKKQISEIEKEIQLRASQQCQRLQQTQTESLIETDFDMVPGETCPNNEPRSPTSAHDAASSENKDPTTGTFFSARLNTESTLNGTKAPSNNIKNGVTPAEPGRSDNPVFVNHDPELEALDPMRPTPPPSPAPGSIIRQQHPQQPQLGRMWKGPQDSSGRPSTTNFISPSSHSGANLAESSKDSSCMSASNSCVSLGPTSPPSATVAAAIQDIKEAIQRTKPLPLQRQIDRPLANSSSASNHPTSSTSCVSHNPRVGLRDTHQHQHSTSQERVAPLICDSSPVWVPRHASSSRSLDHRSDNSGARDPLLKKQRYDDTPDDDADTDQETDRLLGQTRTEDDYGFYDEKDWKKTKSRSLLPAINKGVAFVKSAASVPSQAPLLSTSASSLSNTVASSSSAIHNISTATTTNNLSSSNNCTSSTTTTTLINTTNNTSATNNLTNSNNANSHPSSAILVPSTSSTSSNNSSSQHLIHSKSLSPTSPFDESQVQLPSSTGSSVASKSKKEKDGVKKKRSKEDLLKNPSVLIEGVLFRARYLGSTQLVCEGQPTKATRMMQAEEAVSRIKAQSSQNGTVSQGTNEIQKGPSAATSTSTTTTTTSPSPSIANNIDTLTTSTMCPSSSSVDSRVSDFENSDLTASKLQKTGEESNSVTTATTNTATATNGGGGSGDMDDYFYPEDEESCCEDESLDEGDGDEDLFEKSPRQSMGSTSSLRDNKGMRLPLDDIHGSSNALQIHDNHTHPISLHHNRQLAVGVGGGSSGELGPGNQPSFLHLSPPCGSALPGTMFRLRFIGSLEVDEEIGSGKRRRKRPKKTMVEEAVMKMKAPEGETQPSTEVDLFISTEKIMVLNTDLKEIMMDHALRTISYIADIGDLVVLMARRRPVPTDTVDESKPPRPPKMICHVFESDEAQYIAQSIGQAFQVAYMEFLKANGIEDSSFVREMDYQEVLNSQEIFGDELQMFAKKELQKEVVVPKTKGEILGVVIVESGWGSMLPTVVIANLAPAGAAARCGQLNIGDQIIAINGVSLVGLPLSTCQNYIKNTKSQTVVKLTVVPCPPVVEVKIKRPDTKYQLGFSVQNGVICSLLRGGIAERGGVRVGHRIIEINSQSVVAVPHEKIVNLLATSVGEINMKTMPTSMFRLLTGQETPLYI